MDRTYILHRIYTSENSAKHRNTQLSEMYPDVAGTKEAVEEVMLDILADNNMLIDRKS